MRGVLLVSLALASLASGTCLWRSSHPVALGHHLADLPLAAFWGIARAESDWDPRALSPDHRDRGLWQMRRDFDSERRVDPFDPVASTRWAAHNFRANLTMLGSVDKAVSAHRRGRAWVMRHGIDREYVRRVRAAR